MTVPILWVSLHVPEVKPRGDKADQAVIEAIFDRSLWRPPGAVELGHVELWGKEDSTDGKWITTNGGAVVVIPARDHIGDEAWLCDALDSLDWSVVLLTSMEEWELFDWRTVAEHTDALWVWQGIPGQAEVGARFMPCGWYKNTREGLYDGAQPTPEDRPLDWYFAGQITHARRQECFAAMKKLVGKGENFARGRLVETDHYLAGYADDDGEPFGQYLAHLAETKLVPCPSGPKSLCTARVEEALEAGCVPIVDLVKPEDPQFDYWGLVFGEDYPWPAVYDWGTLPEVVDEQLTEWPANANRCWSFWQQWKRKMAHQLDADIRAAQGVPATDAWHRDDPNSLITVIVTTSPAPLHPSTEHIEETIDSIRAQLPEAEIVVACDGVRPEQEHLRDAYESYFHRLLWLTNFRWHNVVPVRSETWQHQANMTRKALELVTTPLILFVEHDTPLVGPIDWCRICDLVGSGEANVVQFREDTEINKAHEPLMLDHETRIVRGVPVRRTADWRQRPHVAQTRFYRERVMPGFPADVDWAHALEQRGAQGCRAMIEDTFYGVVKNRYDTYGEAGWYDFRLFAYCPDEATDPPLGFKRHRHIDSRGGEPKGDTDILPLEGFK